MTVSITKLKKAKRGDVVGYLAPQTDVEEAQAPSVVDYYAEAENVGAAAFTDTPLRYLGYGRAFGAVDAKTALEKAVKKAAGRTGMAQGVIGWDFTFSAPKAISLAAVIRGDDAIQRAHERAVEKALKFVQVFTRSGKSGVVFNEATPTFVATRHHTNRNLDPQLHTHAVLLNAARDASGKQKSLYHEAHFLSGLLNEFYVRQMELELQALGIDARLVVKEKETYKDQEYVDIEIRGLSDEVLREFSSRRAEIEAADLAGQEYAAIATRAGKRKPPLDPLLQFWQKALNGVKLEAFDPFEAQAKAETEELPPFDADALAEAAFALAEQKSGSALVQRSVVLREAAKLLADCPSRYWLDRFMRLVQRIDESLIPIGGMPPKVVAASALEAEKRVLAYAEEMNESSFIFDEIPILPNFVEGLTDEQTKAVEVAVRSRFSVIAGAAGTGKSRSISSIVKTIKGDSEGEDIVWGLALAARTAESLAETGVDATMTIHRAILALGREDTDPPQTIIIDEAAMVDTRLLDQLIQAAERRGVERFVLGGDHAQLQAIGAGGIFEELINRVPHAEITRVFRQKSEHDRKALEAYRDAILNGDPVEPAEQIISEKFDESVPAGQEIEDAAQRALAGELILAPSRRLVREIGQKAEEMRGIRHEIKMHFYDEEICGVGVGTKLMLKQGVFAGYGARGVELRNGDVVEVVAINDEKVRIRAERLGKEVDIERATFEQTKVAYGYAMTVHAAQGATAENASFYADRTMSHEMLYVALSRHKNRVRVVPVADENGHRLTAQEMAHGATKSKAIAAVRAFEKAQAQRRREQEHRRQREQSGSWQLGF